MSIRVVPVVRDGLLATLLGASGYVFVTLTIFGSSTDAVFAWEMSPLTAATLAAGYGGAALMAATAMRAKRWENARLAVYPGVLFTALVLVASLSHQDTLHLASDNTLPGFVAAWLWVPIHVVLLLLAAWALLRQPRGPQPFGGMPWLMAIPLTAIAIGLLCGGIALYAGAIGWWPWALGELDAQILGAWLITFGVAAGLSVREADLWRMTPGLVAWAATGVLGLIALVRYPGELRAGAGFYAAALVILIAIAGFGLVMGGPRRRL